MPGAEEDRTEPVGTSEPEPAGAPEPVPAGTSEPELVGASESEPKPEPNQEQDQDRPALQEQESTEEPSQEPDAASELSKELTFPELSLRGGSSQDDEEPGEPRDTAAFPKAFERGLVTPETALGDGDGAQSRRQQQPAAAAGRDDQSEREGGPVVERGESGEAGERRSVQFTQRGEPHADELDETKKQKVSHTAYVGLKAQREIGVCEVV